MKKVFVFLLGITLPCLVQAQLETTVADGIDRLAKSLEIHGFVSQGWLRSDDNNFLAKTDTGTFAYNEFGLSFSGNVSDNIRVGIQLLSRTLGDLGQDGVQIDWAFADYYVNEHFGWQVGRTKTPIGLYGDTIDFDSIRTFVFLPQSNYSEINRDQVVATNGLLFYGGFASERFGHLSYSTWIGALPIDSDSGEARLIEDSASNLFEINDIDSEYAYGGRLLWETPCKGLSLTGSLMQIKNTYMTAETTLFYQSATGGLVPTGSPVTIDIPRSDLASFGFEYTWGDLVLASEYRTQRGKAVFNIPRVGDSYRSFYREEYYASATYQLTPKIGVGTYYSARYNDASDKDGSDLELQGLKDWMGWQKDTALAVRYDFSESWSFKAEYHWINGTGAVLTSDNPSGLKKNWEMIALKITYTF